MEDSLNKKAEELRELSNNIKETLDGDADFEIDLEELARLALIAGGAALVLYWLARMIFSGSGEEQKPKKKVKASRKKDSYISRLVKEQVLLILLAVFKKKILPRLEEFNLKDEKESL